MTDFERAQYLANLSADVLDTIGITNNPEDGPTLVRENKPDFVIADMLCAIWGEFQLCTAAKELPKTDLLVLFGKDEIGRYAELKTAGVRAFALHDCNPRDFFTAIEQATRSIAYCDSELQELIEEYGDSL